MQFYKNTPLTLQDMCAPEFGDVDVLEKIIPVAKKHGIRTFCFFAGGQHASRRREELGIALRG